MRNTGTPPGASTSEYESSNSGDPHTTNTGLVVVRDTSTRSRVKRSDIEARAPVMGTITASMLGSATMASRILRPRSSPEGAPPLSTGFDTRR